MTKSKNNTFDFKSKRLKTPDREKLEMYGKVSQLLGANNIKIMCEDGTERNCRIPGKMFKHIWIRQDDIVLVRLWDFQPSKADVVWRYLGFQKSQLERRGELDKLYKFTEDEITPYRSNYDNKYNSNNHSKKHSN